MKKPNDSALDQQHAILGRRLHKGADVLKDDWPSLFHQPRKSPDESGEDKP